MQAFQDGEVLEGKNAYKCPSCKKEVEASRKLQLYTMPEVFVVQLKRFKRMNDFTEKIETMVEFPVEGWDLSGYVHQPQVPLIIPYLTTALLCLLTTAQPLSTRGGETCILCRKGLSSVVHIEILRYDSTEHTLAWGFDARPPLTLQTS